MAKTTKRTRGPGRSVHERIAEGFDRILLDIITNGQITADANGTLTRAHPSAAMMNVVRARVKDARGKQPYTNPAQMLIDEAERRGLAVDGPVGSIGPA